MRFALSLLLLAACRENKPAPAPSPSPTPTVPTVAPRAFNRARCTADITHAQVAVPAGTGPLDSLSATCKGSALTVLTVRGHTLGRMVRETSAGAVFSASQAITTGASEPTVSADPRVLTWRSPMLLDEDARDQWWGALLAEGPSGLTQMGTVVMPPGWKPTGMIVPLGRTSDGVEALSSLANDAPGEQQNPSLMRTVIRFDDAMSPAREQSEDSGTTMLDKAPDVLVEGELRGWEPTHRVALVYALNEKDESTLAAVRIGDGRPEPWGTIPLDMQNARVIAQGVGVNDEAWFVTSTFNYARGAPGEDCLVLEQTRCVHTSSLELVRFAKGRAPVRLPIARLGLGDAITVDAQQRAWVMYVGADQHGPAPAQQKLVRASTSGVVEPMEITALGSLPPFDRPVLVQCGDEPWFVAEVHVGGALAADAGVQPRGGDVAVMAAPLECLTVR